MNLFEVKASCYVCDLIMSSKFMESQKRFVNHHQYILEICSAF